MIILMKAKDYYGRHATGYVVLKDYSVVIHDNKKACKEIYNNLKERYENVNI